MFVEIVSTCKMVFVLNIRLSMILATLVCVTQTEVTVNGSLFTREHLCQYQDRLEKSCMTLQTNNSLLRCAFLCQQKFTICHGIVMTANGMCFFHTSLCVVDTGDCEVEDLLYTAYKRQDGLGLTAVPTTIASTVSTNPTTAVSTTTAQSTTFPTSEILIATEPINVVLVTTNPTTAATTTAGSSSGQCDDYPPPDFDCINRFYPFPAGCCQQYIECNFGSVILRACPGESVFSSVTNTCVNKGDQWDTCTTG